MAAVSETAAILFTILFLFLSIRPTSSSSPLIDELNQPPPPDFSATVAANCFRDPSLRYCNATATDLHNIFKSTVVTRHLCAASNDNTCHVVNLRSRPRLAPLYLSFSFFWKYCPFSILSIDLSNNSLKGPFPADVLQCTQLHALDLSHNEFSGELPVNAFLSLPNLSFLNLSYNDFAESSAEKPEYFKRFNCSSFIRSGLLPGDHKHGFKVTTTILLLFAVLVFVVSMVGLFTCLFTRRPDYLPSLLRRRYKYTPAMLKAATEGFSEKYLVSKNNEKWKVYIGRVRDGTEVEIRVQKGRFLNVSRQAFDEECRVLVCLEHKNLVKVMGWCDQREMRAVVSERIGVCSVEEWILSSPPWKHRLKVAMGVMEGMCYIQQQWPQVGCDLQTGNVMLSEELEPLISKFRVGSHNPEAKMVYKFGLFLLEMMTNKQPRGDFEGGEREFVHWMRTHFNGYFRAAIDEKMKLDSQNYEQVKQTMSIGLACVGMSSDTTLPTVVQVFNMLSGVSAWPRIQNTPSRRKPPPAEGKLEREKTHSKSYRYGV